MGLKTTLKRVFKGSVIEDIHKFMRRSLASSDEMIAYREHEAMIEFFEKFLKPESNVVDIGCHMGEMLAHFCRLSPRGRHVAFEPIPRQARWLQNKFPQAKILQMAVADREGDIEFYHNVDSPAFSGLSVQRPGDKTEVLKVKLTTLDNILDAETPLTLVKIDVEGAELQVFHGARGVLSRWKPSILFEFVDHASARHGAPCEVFFDALRQDFNLNVFLIDSWLQGKPPLTKEEFVQHCKSYTAYNFLAFAV